MQKNTIISYISTLENVTENKFKEYIKSFEKHIKSQIKNYSNISGLEDYKMNKNDYIILYELYTKTKTSQLKVHILLLYMYSYYKLDGFDFNKNYFPMNCFFDFIKKNENMHKIILENITTI